MPRPNILVIGNIVGPEPHWTTEDVMRAVDQGVAKTKAAGFECSCYMIDPARPSSLDEAKHILRSQPWEGVAIGSGVRCRPPLTEFFEELVNIAASDIQSRPRLMFPLTPDDFVNAAVRAFPKDA